MITFPLMAVVQYICDKVGIVSKKGLVGVLKQYYSFWLLYPAVFTLLIANTVNAGADLGAIAVAINLLVPLPPLLLIIPVAVILVVLQVWGSYRLIALAFRWLTLALFAYIAAVFFAHPDMLELLSGICALRGFWLALWPR